MHANTVWIYTHVYVRMQRITTTCRHSHRKTAAFAGIATAGYAFCFLIVSRAPHVLWGGDLKDK